MLKTGDLIDGKYRILRKVGQGGMSVVYMAVNERANKTWAVKEVRKDGTQNFEVVKRGLIVETDLLKKLHHPNLPSIIDVIDGNGAFFVVMDYIEGRTLESVLEEYGALSQEHVIDWGKQLCSVLGYLHSRKPPIIYRDMKPSNVMLKPDGNVVLVDFGTAREYKSAVIEDTVCLGTRGYAAPEQYGGRGQTDARTDIYCLGATMYHLLTGHNPSQPPYELYPVRRWNPGLSVGVEAIIQKCTQQNPEDRYQTCAELMYALENPFLEDVKYRREQRSKFFLFAVPAVLAVVLGGCAGGFYGLETSAARSSYEACIAAAKNSVEKEEEIENYKRAICLRPSESEGYLRLLQDGFLDDGIFTTEESEQLRSALIAYGNGRDTNETVFRQNKRGYDEFSYEAGIAYYYFFEEEESKRNAKNYFETAAASEYLEAAQIERAKRLYTISDYYSRIGLVDETGDAAVSFGDYWVDLTALSQGNLVEIDNERTALIVYEELAAQIVSHAADFKRDGVTEEEMMRELSNAKVHLKTDFQGHDTGSREFIREEITALEKMFMQAEHMVRSAFGKEEQG